MLEYAINFNDNVVGQAQVYIDGLYTCFRCVCSLPDSEVFRVLLKIGERSFDLGVCMPSNGIYIATKKISTKQLGNGEMTFEIKMTHNNNGTFVVVDEQQAFPYISQLAKAVLSAENGKTRIVIMD